MVAKANMKAILAKADALAADSYAPGLFTFFSEKSRVGELKAYAKANLHATSAKEVNKALDEVEFRAEFKPRLAQQLKTWIDQHASGPKR